ncbi:MAG: hypothetical protein N4A71_13060 [Carboxylicivirga sp.]|jgi:c-di-AMP phosphodiesterase-like protein|nr:hypothetical protein [Carboxylicivirga sp.]
MNRKVKRILLLLIIIPIVFLASEVIRLRILYEKSKMTPIANDTNSYSNILNEFYVGHVKFNDSYLVEKKDTLISFELNEKTGLIWVISKINEIDNQLSFQRKEYLGEIEDGTFSNYTISNKPIIKIAYSYDVEKLEDDIKFIYSSNSEESSLLSNNKNDIKRISLDTSLELRNNRNELCYRVDCGFATELYTFLKGDAMFCIFFQ